MKKVSFTTLGCKVNAYDAAYMQELFLKNGYTIADFGMPADIVVVNTCTVTATADKKSRAAIRRAAKCGKVIVTGCLAQKRAQEILAFEGVKAVVGTDDRNGIVSIADRILDGASGIDSVHTLDGCGYEPMGISTPGERTRGFIKIQEGCNNFCSYCIIPYVRGCSRSRHIDNILSEAERLYKNGAKEIVLTGIHIASYEDGACGLGDVIQKIDKTQGARIRLGSIEPGILSEDFIHQAASAKNLCPHFHLSLQSGSGSVLERMNRKYTPQEYLDFVTLLRQYFDNPAITTDIITGFPGETEEEHKETLDFVEKVSFSRIHVFPFSPREGTKAFGMSPKVPKSLAKKRAAELISLGDQYEAAYIKSMDGQRLEVLFEETSREFDGCLEGYSRRYIRVAAKAEKNEMKTVTISRVCDKIAFGS